jgi:hypothetical protein
MPKHHIFRKNYFLFLVQIDLLFIFEKSFEISTRALSLFLVRSCLRMSSDRTLFVLIAASE